MDNDDCKTCISREMELNAKSNQKLDREDCLMFLLWRRHKKKLKKKKNIQTDIIMNSSISIFILSLVSILL